MLRGIAISPEVRLVDSAGKIDKIHQENIKETRVVEYNEGDQTQSLKKTPRSEPVKLFPFGINKNKVEQAMRESRLPLTVVRDLSKSDIFLTTKSHYKRYPRALLDAEMSGRQIYVIRNNSFSQIEQFVRNLSSSSKEKMPFVSSDSAIGEAEYAVDLVLNGETAVELSPQSAYVRRLQHLLAQGHNLRSTSNGKAQNRRVTIFRSARED
jgi:hypothetical protein